jgi:hypothetical protein
MKTPLLALNDVTHLGATCSFREATDMAAEARGPHSVRLTHTRHRTPILL